MSKLPWPSPERMLAIADAAEALRNAIWLGHLTSAPDSPARLPGFVEGTRDIQSQLRRLDMLLHGRSVKATNAFCNFATRRNLFVERCSQLNLQAPADGLDQWNDFFDWELSEAALPGDEEYLTFSDREKVMSCVGTTTWNWPSNVVDRYNSIWKLFAGLKPYFGYGTIVYSLNHWERPSRSNIWHSAARMVRTVQSAVETPEGAELDVTWLHSLAIQGEELRKAVLAEQAERVNRPKLWPLRPFAPSSVIVVGPGRPLSSIPKQIPIESFQPTPNDTTLLERAIPGVDPCEPNWDHVRHYLMARHFNVSNETPMTTILQFSATCRNLPRMQQVYRKADQ